MDISLLSTRLELFLVYWPNSRSFRDLSDNNKSNRVSDATVTGTIVKDLTQFVDKNYVISALEQPA